MTTTTFRRTRCEGCNMQQEHTSDFPYGWGRLDVSHYDRSGSISTCLVRVVLCTYCLAAMERTVHQTLEKIRSKETP